MYYKNNYKQASIQLVQCNSQGQYEANEEAFKFIRNIPEPIAVISVAGLYRTGKSYLLNRVLLNRSDGFNVGPTINACTKGLWIWGKPIIGRNKQNQLVNVLIIDSEGFGAVTEDSNHDARIFALTLLLSSCFLYNSVGSIDELAIENVGLITNIAKSIRSKNEEGIDNAQSSQYFPQFYWVLRDFTLQLTSGEGHDLTSKQYLERSLEVPKDGDDEKSRIRKALTNYFPERDCITLVRPLTNEESLQELDKLEFEKLRPQFVEQVIMMRKRVLNNLAVKKFYGKAIDGEIFCQIVQKYIQVINNGAVPQIESIWSYISKNECDKAAAEALLCFEQHLTERILERLPVSPEELEEATQSLIKSILSQFKKKVGSFQKAKEAKRQLQLAMEERLKKVRAENQKQARKELERCIDLEFQVLERKIRSSEFKSIPEMIHEFEKQAKEFSKIVPLKGSLSNTILNEYLYKKTAEGAQGLLRTKQTELEKLKTTLKQSQKKTESQMKQLRSELNSVRNTNSTKINKLETERTELISKQQTMKEAMAELRSEKERLEHMIDSETRRDKSLSTKSFHDLRSKLNTYESRAEEAERKLFLVHSQAEKKQALLGQKIEFQEKMIEELKRKEEKSYEELKSLKENYLKQLKEANARSETMSKNYQKKVAQLTDKNSQLETELHRLNELLKIQKEQSDRLQSENSLKMDDLSRTVNRLNTELKDKEQAYKSKLTEKMTDDNRLNERLSSLEQTAREKEQIARTLKVELNKEKALLAQKQEFYELEIRELKRKHEEQAQKSDAMMRLLESKQSQKGEALSQIRNQYAKELQQLQKSTEAERRQLKSDLSVLQIKSEETQTGLRRDNQEMKQELKILTEKYEVLEETKNKLLEQNKMADSQKMRSLKALEDRHLATVRALERQMDNIKETGVQELRESQRQNEQTLTQLKNFYEIEKERLEKKLLEYQQKCKDSSQMDSEQLRLRYQEKYRQYEEQIESLQNDLRETRLQARNYEHDYQCRLAVATRELENLRQERKDLKETLQTTRMTLQEEFGHTLDNLRSEKTQMAARLDQSNIELNKKQKQIFTLNHKKQQLEASLAKRDQALESSRVENENERKHYEFELDKLKQKAHKINDQYLAFKIENEKQLALALQEKDFLSKRVNQLQEERERDRNRAEQRLSLVRSQLSAESKDKYEKISSQYAILEQRFQKSKKTWKDEQARLQKQLTGLDKDKAALHQRLNLLETAKQQQSALQLNQSQLLTSQLSQMKEQFTKEKQRLMHELQKQKYLTSQLEELKSQAEINYEKDRVLWANKLQFVESQKDQAKQDLSQALKKFELTMNLVSKNKPTDETFQDIAKSIERKYSWQLESLKETYQKKLQQGQERTKALSSELKTIRQAYGELKSQKQLQAQREKIQYMHMSELSHLSILQNNSEQFEKERLEYEERLIKQKDDFTRRLAELERRNKQAQSKSSNVTFGFEKEYVKWNIDRKCLEDRIEQLIDANEKLYRELERYKIKDKEKEKPSARRLFRLD